MSTRSNTLEANIRTIRERIAEACHRVGRDPASVELMAVSKFHPAEVVAEASRLGLTSFGESRVQEAKSKIPACPAGLHWEFIGHLQSNKAKEAVRLFDRIQSVDSLDLAQDLERHAASRSPARRLPILLEVNLAGEDTKFGWRPEDLLKALPALQRLKAVELQGLMTLAPYAPQPETARPVFRALQQLLKECSGRLEKELTVLSMGMSGDLEVAIEEGSTLVRVGTALFGSRSVAAPQVGAPASKKE